MGQQTEVNDREGAAHGGHRSTSDRDMLLQTEANRRLQSAQPTSSVFIWVRSFTTFERDSNFVLRSVNSLLRESMSIWIGFDEDPGAMSVAGTDGKSVEVIAGC